MISAFLNRVRSHLLAYGILVATLASTGTMIGMWVMWAVAQSDPQIIERGVSYFHRGINGDGLTIVQWKAAGHPEAQWLPKPISTARPGETIWLRRDLEFTNKTLATVTRAMRCDGGFQHSWPPSPPPTRTSERTVKQFPVTIPAEAAGACLYEVAAIFYKNPSQPEVRVAFQPVPIVIAP